MRRFIAALALLATPAIALAEDPDDDIPVAVKAAEKEFQRAVKGAKEKLRADLEAEKLTATKAGDLEVAIAIRERIVQLEAEEPEPPVGEKSLRIPNAKVDLSYDNETKRRYDFSTPGQIRLIGATYGTPVIKPVPRPEKAAIYWHRQGDQLIGFVEWYPTATAEQEGKVEYFIVRRDGKITSTLYSTLVPGARSEGRVPKK